MASSWQRLKYNDPLTNLNSTVNRTCGNQIIRLLSNFRRHVHLVDVWPRVVDVANVTVPGATVNKSRNSNYL